MSTLSATTPEELARREAEYARQRIPGTPYTQGELQAIFSLIQNPEDWKAPIEAQVAADLLPITLEAIEYFTATRGRVSRVSRDGKRVTVQADGYRRGPAGDH